MIPAPPNCLACGYPREGLQRDARCPECGQSLPDVDAVVVIVRAATTGRFGIMSTLEFVVVLGIVLILTAITAIGLLEIRRSSGSAIEHEALLTAAGFVVVLLFVMHQIALRGGLFSRTQVWLTRAGYGIRRGWGRVPLRPWPANFVVTFTRVNDAKTRVVVEAFVIDSGYGKSILSFDFEGATEAADELINWVRRCCRA